MVEITVLELNIDEGTFTTALPFSAVTDGGEDLEETEETADEDETTDEESGSGGRSKALAIVGVFLFLVLAAAVIKYLSGGDEPEVEIETSDDGPIGVTVESDDE